MKTLSLASLLLTVSLLLPAARAADELKTLSGQWSVASAVFAGQALPPPVLAGMSLRMDGASYEATVETEKGKIVDKGTVALSTAAQLKRMTITGTDGPNKGKTFLAIYELNGDTLRVCYDLGGGPHPTEFKSAPDTKLLLTTYQRAK